MTTRQHLKRYYRELHRERHQRKLRVNSHRKNLGDWRLVYRLHDDGRFVIAMVRDGIDQVEYEVPVRSMSEAAAKINAIWSTKSGRKGYGIDFCLAGATT